MATRKPEHKDFMNIKTRIKELAAKAEAVTEFARGDYLTDNARKFLMTLAPKHRAELAGYKVKTPVRGSKEAIEEARQLRHSRKLKPTVSPKPYGNGNWVSVLKHDENWGKQ